MTVNRWENGKTIPNRLAQTEIYEFCKNRNISFSDVLVKKIEEEVKKIPNCEDRLILYHSSKFGIEGNIAPISREKCDFGAGFYMGTDPLQPLTLICDYEKSKFYIVSLSLEGLSNIEIPLDLSWAMFVALNRGKMNSIKGTKFFQKYQNICLNKDLIIGYIANDRMFYVLDNFFLGNITDQVLIKSLSALQSGKQYVAISQKARDAIRIEKKYQSHI